MSSGSSSTAAPAPPPRRWRLGLAGALVVAALGAVALVAARRPAPAEGPLYRRVSFKRGTVLGARFTPDGQGVVYGAAWDGRPFEVFATRVGTPESRPLGLADAAPLALSPTGQLAILLHVRKGGPFASPMVGTLAQAPLEGGAPRELLLDATDADFSPDGQLAAVHAVHRAYTLFDWDIQFPIGTVVFRGRAQSLRFSPDGARLAFVHTDELSQTRGWITVIDRDGGHPRRIGRRSDIRGLAWSPSGKELLFVGYGPGEPMTLRAVSLDGRERVLARVPGAMTLLAVSPTGHALVTRATETIELRFRGPADAEERDLSWLDQSYPSELSPDGAEALFGELGAAVPGTTAYVRRTDGAPPVQLGEGWPIYWTPDGRSVIVERDDGVALVPTGAGSPAPLPGLSGLEVVEWANWTPDGRRLLAQGRAPGQRARLWVKDLPDGAVRPITEAGDAPEPVLIMPDGKRLLFQHGRGLRIVSLDGAAAIDGPSLEPDDFLVQLSVGGDAVYVQTAYAQRLPLHIELARVDLATGRRTPLRRIVPADPTGAVYITLAGHGITPDGGAYLYGVTRHLGDLYVVEGLALD
jgi:dipeptidyl aminopeptidase/acylaminoacyl peptidase